MPGSVSNVEPFTVQLTFHGSLDFFLQNGAGPVIGRCLKEKTSIKDLIESCGIPHPEVDLILLDERPVDFHYVVEKDAQADVYPVSWKRDTFFAEERLQVKKVEKLVADVHLGKLVRNLRLLGLDTIHNQTLSDQQLIELAQRDERALLTRDRRLLMHRVVRHGYYLQSQDPFKQTIEVLQRFELSSGLAPFTRCIRCNDLLEPVAKAEIIDRLEPLTKIYYNHFRRCISCRQIYWPGSHFKKLQARITHLTAT